MSLENREIGMGLQWCEQREVHVGFVRVDKPKDALIAPECVECGKELNEPYYYDIQNAEPICDEHYASRSGVEKKPKEKPPKKTTPRPKGQPTKKSGKKPKVENF